MTTTLEGKIENKHEADNDTSGNITSGGEQTAVCDSVQPGWENASSGDSLQSTFIVEIAPDWSTDMPKHVTL